MFAKSCGDWPWPARFRVACIMKRYIQQVLSECHAFFQYVHITLWTWDEVIDDHAVAKKPQGHQAPPVA